MVRRGQAARDCPPPPSPAFPDRCATWVRCALLFYSPPLVVCVYQVTSPSPPPARRRVWVGFWSPGSAFRFFLFPSMRARLGSPASMDGSFWLLLPHSFSPRADPPPKKHATKVVCDRKLPGALAITICTRQPLSRSSAWTKPWPIFVSTLVFFAF